MLHITKRRDVLFYYKDAATQRCVGAHLKIKAAAFFATRMTGIPDIPRDYQLLACKSTAGKLEAPVIPAMNVRKERGVSHETYSADVY